MKGKFIVAAFLWFSPFCLSNDSKTSLSNDLITPAMTGGRPAPSKRVRQVAPEYKGTKVYHTLYLPTDWQKSKRYPVLVEYTGNKFPLVDQPRSKGANPGYGLSGGKVSSGYRCRTFKRVKKRTP